MVSNINWDSLKSTAHLREIRKNPLSKVMQKLHLFQGIKDTSGQVHYVSRKAFKKWSISHGLELYKPLVTIQEIRNAISIRNSTQLTNVLEYLKFPEGFTSAQKDWIRKTIHDQYPESITEAANLVIDNDSDSLQISWNAQGEITELLWNDQPLRWNPGSVPLQWPKELGEYNLTREQMRSIDQYVATHFSTWNNLSEALTISRKESGLPVSLCIVPDRQGKVGRVIMLVSAKRVGVIGRGGERTIKHGYDLIHGLKLARKNIQSEIEIITQKKGKGPQIFAERSTQKGRQVFEPVYSGSLDKLVSSPLSLPEIEGIARDLLKSLASFHRQPGEDDIPSYHGDIKPENILWRRDDEGKLEVVLSDFGGANADQGASGTREYYSPESVALLATPRLKYDRRTPLYTQFRQDNAQKADVWAMGLTLLKLMTQGKDLPSINRVFEGKNFFKGMNEAFSKVTQEQIDQEIRALQMEHFPQSEIWDLIKRMLVIDVNQRYSASSLI